jgi:hypothetical protein
MTVIHVCAVTKNKSISATTLHTMMNIHMNCMIKGIHLDISFVPDKAGLPRLIKAGERIIWLEYGTNLDETSIHKAIAPFDKNLQVLVFPAVKEGINWDMFAKKTKAGSTEPANQRGLDFDTAVGRRLADSLYEVTSTEARVWAMDGKPVDKKLRGEKVPVKLPSDESMFRVLQGLGIRIGAVTSASVICHFVHECVGNILETAGVRMEA